MGATNYIMVVKRLIKLSILTANEKMPISHAYIRPHTLHSTATQAGGLSMKFGARKATSSLVVAESKSRGE